VINPCEPTITIIPLVKVLEASSLLINRKVKQGTRGARLKRENVKLEKESL
jgi:hypothetical protein